MKSMKIGVLLGMILGLWGTGVMAGIQTLTSLDETCRLFYPTDKNVTGWRIKTSLPCPGGRVHGQGRVTLMNAFHKPEEELSGFFSQGYWTDVLITTPLQLASSKEGPALLFLLAQDVQPTVSYFGYMTAQKNNPFYYSAFKLCSSARVLVQTSEDLADETFQKQVALRVTGAIQPLCPEVPKITLFARISEDAMPFLYGTLDTKTKEVHFEKVTSAQISPIHEEVTEVETALYVPESTVFSVKIPVENPSHLFLKSLITGQKIKGRARVHITEALHVDEPIKATILGAVTPGWGIVEGTFLKSREQMPIIQVRSWIPEEREAP